MILKHGFALRLMVILSCVWFARLGLTCLWCLGVLFFFFLFSYYLYMFYNYVISSPGHSTDQTFFLKTSSYLGVLKHVRFR